MWFQLRPFCFLSQPWFELTPGFKNFLQGTTSFALCWVLCQRFLIFSFIPYTSININLIVYLGFEFHITIYTDIILLLRIIETKNMMMKKKPQSIIATVLRAFQKYCIIHLWKLPQFRYDVCSITLRDFMVNFTVSENLSVSVLVTIHKVFRNVLFIKWWLFINKSWHPKYVKFNYLKWYDCSYSGP